MAKAGHLVCGLLTVAAVVVAQAAAGAGEAQQWIVFSASPGGLPPAQLFRIQTDGTGLQQLTEGKQPATDPAFSPDARRIAFVRLGEGIFVMNVDGGAERRLTKGPRDLFPIWSPNGKQIAFVRPRKTDWRLYVMSASGRSQRLLELAPPAGRPTWTRNGKSIYIPAQGALAKVDARTGRLQREVQGNMDLPTETTVSPDATTLAFVDPRPSVPGCGEVSCLVFALYLADVRHGRARRFVNDAGPAGWSPDGKRLVFVHGKGLVLRLLASSGRTTLSVGSNVATADAPPAWQPR